MATEITTASVQSTPERSFSIESLLQDSVHSCETIFSSLRYGCRTILLFTFSDIKTILAPAFFFGLANTIRAQELSYERIPVAIGWIWLNLLCLCIHNQSSTAAVEEDKINKPWRPLAAGRLTVKQSRRLLKIAYLSSFLVSMKIGGVRQSLVLLVLSYWYNSKGGSDSGIFVRNLLNCLGISAFNNGSFRVLTNDPSMCYGTDILSLQLMIGTFILTTIQIQDFADVPGDIKRGRLTLPIVLGDSLARSLTVVSVLFWILYIPYWWSAGMAGWITTMIGGGTVLACLIPEKSRKADAWAWAFWCFWLLQIYALPLFA